MKAPNVSFRQMRAFVTLAHAGSFRAASRELNLSQSALTTTIQQVEAALGATLFDRTTRRVELTAVGRDFLRAATRILDDVAATLSDVRAVAEGRRGQVVVSTVFSFASWVLPRVVAAYAARFPNVALKVLDFSSRGVQQSVLIGEADLGICGSHGLHEDLVFTHLTQDRYCALLPRKHALTRRRRVPWTDLLQQPFVALARGTQIREILESALRPHDLIIRATHEATHSAVLAAMVERGLGVTALPETALRAMPLGSLVYRPAVEPEIERDIGMIQRRGRSLSPVALAFRDELQRYVVDGIDAIP
jgi:DNA-binding transcriptional LysR family regulator